MPKLLEAVEVVLGTPSPTLAVLILSSQARALIGPGGAIIREIRKEAGNAKIKVHCDTHTEKAQQYTKVTVEGPSHSKIFAATKIYEKLYKQHSHRTRSRSPRSRDTVRIFGAVPQAMVARLIGKNSDSIRALM